MKQTIEVNDPVLERKVAQLAKRKGIAFEQCLQELCIKSVRITLGLETDLTRNEAAQRMGCCLSTVRTYLKQGLFPNHYFRSARALRIPVADVEALKRNRAGTN